MSKFTCEHCQTQFGTRSNLFTHKKTAKYCLKLQGSDSAAVTLPVCEYCDKEFTQKTNYHRHLEVCELRKSKMYDENQTLSAQNKLLILENTSLTIENESLKRDLLEKSEKIAKLEKASKSLKRETLKLKEDLAFEKGQNAGFEKVKPATNNVINQYVNPKLKHVPIDNILPLTNETIELSLPKYTYKDFNRTKKGLVDHLLKIVIFEDENGVINKNYVCTNRARNSFHILVNDKKWTQDNGATYIHTYLNMLRPQVKEYAKMFEDEVIRMQDEGDPLDMIIIRRRKEKIDPFNFGVKEDPGQDSREKLLMYIRAGIRDHLYI